jgi:3-oxoacyl-[acyl-carrier-protein] synthase-3
MAPDRFGIAAIGCYLPAERRENAPVAERFGFAPDFLETKLGILETRRKAEDEDTSDLCVKAFADLRSKCDGDLEGIDLIAVVTQNPDEHGLPHTSAVVHRKLGLPRSCFAFDISLGCSGFVAALAIVTGYLKATGGRRALLFTADPYSKIQDPEDRNTALIFSDAAAVALIGETPRWRIGPAFDCGTEGARSSALRVAPGGRLEMNGRAVFDFCALNVPGSIERVLAANEVAKEEVDAFVLHPGSKYIVDTIHARLKLPPVGFPAPYGNTVSSSVPLMLSDMDPNTARIVVVSGFGVGLSWATTVLRTL